MDFVRTFDEIEHLGIENLPTLVEGMLDRDVGKCPEIQQCLQMIRINQNGNIEYIEDNKMIEEKKIKKYCFLYGLIIKGDDHNIQKMEIIYKKELLQDFEVKQNRKDHFYFIFYSKMQRCPNCLYYFNMKTFCQFCYSGFVNNLQFDFNYYSQINKILISATLIPNVLINLIGDYFQNNPKIDIIF